MLPALAVSLLILAQPEPLVKNFFQVFSRLFEVVRRPPGFIGRSSDSLHILPPKALFVKAFFHVFSLFSLRSLILGR